MLAILLHSIHNPDILAHATLLKKNIIIKLIILLSVILSIPTIIHTNQLIQQTQSDLNIIANHLPSFDKQTSNAIQTTHAYLLYDPNNNVSQSTLEKTTPQYTLSIVVQNETMHIHIFGSQILTYAVQSNEQMKALLQSLVTTLPITQLLTPLFVLLFNIFSIIIQNYMFTLGCQFFFMFRQKLIKFQHLWRVSLFASFGPYIILSVVNLFKLNAPMELFWILAYIIYVQNTVINVVTTK